MLYQARPPKAPPRQWWNGTICHCVTSFAASTFHSIAAGGVMGVKRAFFVPGDLDLWPWHSNSSVRETKHVFHANLAQIRSVVPEIFEAQTKKSQAVKTEPYFRAVITTTYNYFFCSTKKPWHHTITCALLPVTPNCTFQIVRWNVGVTTMLPTNDTVKSHLPANKNFPQFHSTILLNHRKRETLWIV